MSTDSKNNVQTSDYLSYYLTTNAHTICRICLEKAPKLMPIFDAIKPPHFSILIMACASVQVTQNDTFPPNICTKCVSKLNVAFQFKTQCEIADAKLRQAFENVQNKLEIQIDIPIPIVQEQEQEQDKTEDLILFTTTLENEGIKLELIDNLSSKPKNHELKLQNKKVKTPAKNHSCHICTKIFRTKASLVHHIRIHTGERPYVCHLCDKSFVNGGHLHTHMRTHTGEKNHVCAACPKAFPTAQQLTKHTIAIHTGERPYSCRYCPKRFASSSNLNTHIKVHTGEKNYYCDQCGKAFGTKGQLDQHMLVHTGEKAFLCEFCQKRFSQKAHLVRHSKMHRNNDENLLKISSKT